MNNSDYDRMGREKGKVSKVFLILTILFAVGMVTFGSLYFINGSRSGVYANTLENVYQRCIYELLDNVNNIDDNLTKAIVANNKEGEMMYLKLVSDECKYAQNNFSLLPITMNTVDSGVKFINQMDGYCTSLVKAGKKLTGEQVSRLGELYEIVSTLKGILNNVVDEVLSGKTIMSSNILNDDGLTEFSLGFQEINSEDISYPSMIFDGPFSDSLYNKEAKGLTGQEINKEQAQTLLNSYLNEYNIETITFVGQTKGNFETYDFNVEAEGYSYYAQLTKKGGFLLTLSAYSEYNESVLHDEKACEDIAKTFAQYCGVDNMESTWVESGKGVCYVNLAPVIDNIIYYPDLIKVKIDMSSGKVVGYEAQNYAYNHVERKGLAATYDAVKAREKVKQDMVIQSQKLALIPLDYGGEELCYEFKGEYNDSVYFVYINAKTGNEERVLKVVGTSEGQLIK